ncbi:hypothetical protein AX17_001656 [Amanita inopinata Kibby_2008]|nr:hypothetical protein AX17_001656 [Amanita inopinata Kibby_2008]
MLASASRLCLQRSSTRLCIGDTRARVAQSSLGQTRQESNSALEQLSVPKSNNPSKQVWRFKSDPREEQRNSVAMKKAGKARLDIVSNAARGNFSLCLQAAARMKLDGVRPDLQVYNALMSSTGPPASWQEAWAILDDMLLVGVKPDAAIFNHLLQAHRHRPSLYIWKILDKMNELGIQPNPAIYTFIISHFAADKNLELALRYFCDMKSRELVPQLRAAQVIVKLAADLGYPRLAIDIATSYEQWAVKKLEHGAWLSCLASSAQECYADGVLHCWKIVVETLNITPDEGVCLAVLQTAARHGFPDLATDTLRVLKLVGVEWQEHHFACIVEAFCRNSQVKEALITLDIMHSNKTPAGPETTLPIARVIGSSTDTLDNTWNVIDELQKEKKRIDPAALNALIQAAVGLGDLQRAMGSYKSFGEYNAMPDVSTFNTLLNGCVAASHRQLGDVLLGDMKSVKIKPNEQTYEYMIYLCLTQETYEDAFFYLEEMKAAGYIPPVRAYASLIRKCMSANDPRYRIALEEMGELGYLVPPSLEKEVKEYAHRGHYGDNFAAAEPKQIERLDGAAQRFIETGGLTKAESTGGTKAVE